MWGCVGLNKVVADPTGAPLIAPAVMVVKQTWGLNARCGDMQERQGG